MPDSCRTASLSLHINISSLSLLSASTRISSDYALTFHFALWEKLVFFVISRHHRTVDLCLGH